MSADGLTHWSGRIGSRGRTAAEGQSIAQVLAYTSFLGRADCHFWTMNPALAQLAKSSREPLPASMATTLINFAP